MRADERAHSTRWKAGTLLLVCLTLELACVCNALAEAPPASPVDSNKSPEPTKAEQRAPKASGPASQPLVCGGANAITFPYMRDTIEWRVGLEHHQHVKIEQLSEAETYRRLMDGRIDIGSVFKRPEEVGVKDFERAFKEPPTVHVVGHVACVVIAPAHRKLESLSLDQLRGILSGKITDWDQLKAGRGRIKVVADELALQIAYGNADAAKPKPGTKADLTLKDAQVIRYFLDAKAASNHQERLEAQTGGKTLPPADDYLGLTVAADTLTDRFPKSRLRLLAVGDGRGKPIAPSPDSVADGTYPLSLTWRIIVRPGASKLAKSCAEWCLRAYDGSLVNAYYVREWLIQPAYGELQAGIIRYIANGWNDAFEAARDAYVKANPGVRFIVVSGVGSIDKCSRLLAHEVDLLAYPGSLKLFYDETRDMGEGMRKLYPESLPERAIAWRPLLAVVHPRNPIDAITIEQFQRVVTHDITPWSLLGRKGDGIVRRYRHDYLAERDALFGGKLFVPHVTAESPEVDPDRRRKQQLTTDDLSKDYKYGQRFIKSYIVDRDLLEQLSGDEDGVGIVMQTKLVMASGLKVLKLAPGNAAPTAANVASGRYPARAPLCVLLHPKANAATKGFVDWLSTPEAAALMAPHYVYSPRLEARPASVDSRPAPASPSTAPNFQAPTIRPFAGTISGAVAVLPAESLSAYFMMDNPNDHAAWEQAITATLVADGRLKLVDRTQIDRVLVERQLSLLTEGPRQAIISADVFVLSHVVTESEKSFLRIQAILGPTASLLAGLKLPIDPAHPTSFDVPLEEKVKAWWPGVLAELSRARQHPTWSVVDVYSDRPDAYEAADALAASLNDRLMHSERAFLADYRAMPELQQEVLMAMMGLGRFGGGRLTPAADYLLEGRLIDPATLELRILAGRSLRPLATTRIDASSRPQMLEKAEQWLDAQVAARSGGPVDSATASTAQEGFEWARRQARSELASAEEVTRRIEAFAAKAETRRLAEGRPAMLDEDRRQLDSLRARLRRHMERSAHLDPTLEPAVLWTTRMRQGNGQWNDLASLIEAAVATEQFVQRFPQSREHRGMMEHGISYYSQLSWTNRRTLLSDKNRTNDARDAQQRRLRTLYLGKAVDLYRQYASRYIEVYDRPDESRGSWFSFPGFIDHYLFYEAEYLYLTAAAPAAIDEAVKQWSKIFDAHPKAGPHSDFVRLLALGYRNDKAGFLTQLLAMQKSHPDPKSDYWERGYSAANGELGRLFGGSGLGRWREGKATVGQLPYAGYDPAKDTFQPTWRNWE